MVPPVLFWRGRHIIKTEYYLDRGQTEADMDRPSILVVGSMNMDLYVEGANRIPKFGESILVRHPSDRWESTGYRLCMEAMRAYLYECYRKNDLSVLAHIGGRIGEDALSDVAAFLLEEEYHLCSGKSSARTVKVINDSSAEEEILVEFRLLRENGAVVRNLSRRFLLPPGGRTDWIVELPGIPVSRPEFATVLLSASGKRSGTRYRKQIPFTVFPEVKMSFPRAVLFDPVGESAAAFAASGIRIPLIRSLKDAGKGKVLVIGRNALAKADSETLNTLVAGGLRVLVLRQDDFTWGFPFEVADGNFASDGAGAVIASPGHPVFRGILEEDLRYWQNRDRVPVVFENAPLTPSSARVKSLLTGSKTAFTGDMHYSPLFEGRHGKGMYLVSALAFTDSLPFDPAARLLFRNLLQYLSAPLVTPGKGAIAADRADWNRLRSRFGMNAADNAFRKGRTESMILWNPAEPVSPELVRMVKNGGTLYLRVPDSTRLKEVERLFGFRIGLSAHVSEFAAMTVRDPLFEGLTQQDFIWGKNIQNGGRPPDPKHLLGTQVFVSAQKGFSPLLVPAYLAEFPFGKGRVILDSTRLNEMNSREAYAVTGTIFRNLGLDLSWNPKQEKAFHVPDGVFEFYPLNLSASANLSFSDEFPGDRKGGWVDGGHSNDLRMLPRGNNRFCGIPVSIPPEAVSVKGAVWKQLPEKAVEIPVHRALDKIYFFHTCGYASLQKGEPMAQYVIYYEDRADWIPGKPDPFVKVPVRNQLHVQDWWFYDRIAKGELAMPDARIGWRGEKQNANRGIAVMEERESDPAGNCPDSGASLFPAVVQTAFPCAERESAVLSGRRCRGPGNLPRGWNSTVRRVRFLASAVPDKPLSQCAGVWKHPLSAMHPRGGQHGSGAEAAVREMDGLVKNHPFFSGTDSGGVPLPFPGDVFGDGCIGGIPRIERDLFSSFRGPGAFRKNGFQSCRTEGKKDKL